ncbi:hypothetical protein [Butyrivibrio sp. JL13D10]|uniref:hypothetical protein n=1 Tax=Butyrivibrio sp. JL13D10 TaxID=3236815 RepID=UPI0038B492FE
MGIFFTILKITGIVLLSILGLLLFILILVLFVPIRYRAGAAIEETDLEKEASLILEKVTAKASFSWLLHIIRGKIAYPESKEFQLKVLCFTVYPPKNKKNENDENQYEDHLESAINDDKKNNEVVEVSSESDSINTEDNSIEQGQSNSEEETAEADKNMSDEEPEVTDKNESDEESAITDNKDSDDFDEEEEEESARSFFEFIGDIFEVIGKIIRVPQDVFRKIQYTTSRIYAKINMVKNTLSNDIFKRAFEVTKKQVFRVLRMILPRTFRADFLVGTNDPTVTADIFAAYGILYPILVNKVFITPEFERSVLAGKAHLKGRITVFTIVWAAAILYFNKDCRKTYRRFRKIIDS